VVLPNRNNEVGKDESVSGKQHAEYELEEEDELLESLSVSGDGGGESSAILGDIGPLPGVVGGAVLRGGAGRRTNGSTAHTLIVVRLPSVHLVILVRVTCPLLLIIVARLSPVVRLIIATLVVLVRVGCPLSLITSARSSLPLITSTMSSMVVRPLLRVTVVRRVRAAHLLHLIVTVIPLIPLDVAPVVFGSRIERRLVIVITIIAALVVRGCPAIALIITTPDCALLEATTDAKGDWDLYRDGTHVRNGRLDSIVRGGAHQLGNLRSLVGSEPRPVFSDGTDFKV